MNLQLFGTQLRGGELFQFQQDTPDLFGMTSVRLKRLFKRWSKRRQRYVRSDVLDVIKESNLHMERIENDGTLKHIRVAVNYLRDNNINRGRRLKDKITRKKKPQLNSDRIMRDLNGVGTIVAAMKWLTITYQQLSRHPDFKNRTYVLTTASTLHGLLADLENSAFGTLHNTACGGKIGNEVGKSFENEIMANEAEFRKLLATQGLVESSTEIHYNVLLYRKRANGDNDFIRELDVVGLSQDGKLSFWGEIKSNIHDVPYKAKTQFYKFLKIFTGDCIHCMNKGLRTCGCRKFIKLESGETIFDFKCAWMYEIEEVAALHGFIISQLSKRKLPLPSELGHVVLPIFFNFLVGKCKDIDIEEAARTVRFMMDKLYRKMASRISPNTIIFYKTISNVEG